jgi:hypothetical protein
MLSHVHEDKRFSAQAISPARQVMKKGKKSIKTL